MSPQKTKQSITPLGLALLATTLISGVALVYAWTGPSASPYGANAAVPLNAGSIAQTKSASLTSTGLGSAGNLIVTGNSTLGGGYAPRAALDVNGVLITNAGYTQQPTTWYDILGDRIGVGRSLYSYGSVCTGNSTGDCAGSGGVVIGGTNSAAAINILNGGGVNWGSNSGQLSSDGNGAIELGPTNSAGAVPYIDFHKGVSAVQDYNVRIQNTGNNRLDIATVSNGTVFTVNGANVGVGTTTPGQKLTVAGSIQSSSGGFVFPDGTTQTTSASSQWTTSGANIYNGNSGNVGVGTSNPIRKLQVDGELSLSRFDRVGYINVSDINGNNGGSLVLRGLGTGGSAEVGVAITLVGSGTGNTVFGNSGANYIRGNTYFNGVLYDEGNSAYYINPDTTSIFNDLRSNVLYDNNDTNYYTDANSTSRFNNFRPNTIDCINGTCPANGAVRMTPNFHLNSGAGSAVILNWDNGTTGAAQTLRVGNGAGADVYNVYANGGSWQAGGATIGGTIINNSADPYVTTNANNKWLTISGGSGWSTTGAVIHLRGNTATSDPDSISMYTGNASRLRIETNGNVGIGTGASYKLDVAGQIRSSSGGYVFPDGTTQTTAFTGSAGYIQNQYASAQTANAWINGLFKIQTASPTIYFQNTGYKSAMIHVNSNQFYILSGCGASNTDTWCANGSNWPMQIDLTNDSTTFGGNLTTADGGTVHGAGGVFGTGSGGDSWLQYSNGNNYLRGNTYLTGVLYDENNSAYYVDPNNTTNVNSLVFADLVWNAGVNIRMPGSGEMSFDFADGDGNDRWHVYDPTHGAILTVSNNGMVGVGQYNPTYKFTVNGGISHFSRDGASECCSGANATISLAENTASTGKTARIEFHDAGVSEGYIELANGGTRRIRFADNQGSLMGIETTGNVGIRQAPGGHALDVNGDTWTNGWMRTQGNAGWYSESWGGGWYMVDSTWIRSYGGKPVYMENGFDTHIASAVGCDGGMGGGYQFRICGAAGVGAAAYYYTSDIRLKNNLVPLQDSLSKVRSLQGYTFNWKEGGRADVGVIAQEVEKVFPQLVKTGPDGFKSVEYGNLVAPLIEAVKELANNLDALATRVFNTENRQTELEKRVEAQQAQIDALQKQLTELSKKK